MTLTDPIEALRRARLRTRRDGLLLIALALGIPALIEPGALALAERLMLAIALIGIGQLLFVWRRRSDLDVIARAQRRQARALARQGVSVAQWHAGAPLPPRA